MILVVGLTWKLLPVLVQLTVWIPVKDFYLDFYLDTQMCLYSLILFFKYSFVLFDSP